MNLKIAAIVVLGVGWWAVDRRIELREARAESESQKQAEEKPTISGSPAWSSAEDGTFTFNPTTAATSEKQHVTDIGPAWASQIAFYYNTDARVIIHSNGKVEWNGDLDTAAVLFWTRITQVFPGFKESICEGTK
jgi:hypothetical protein